MKPFIIIVIVLISIVCIYFIAGYFSKVRSGNDKLPELSGYFKPGDVFRSNEEGLTQKVIKQSDGQVYCEVILDPHAVGPPKHIHTGFDETFNTGKHGLYIISGNDTLHLKPFESYTISKGIAHKFYNPTGDTLSFTNSGSGFPVEFAFGLVQMYGYMDKNPSKKRSTGQILLQFSLFSQYFDSLKAEGDPPPVIQKVLFFFLRPLARLKGLKSWYPEFNIIKRNSNE